MNRADGLEWPAKYHHARPVFRFSVVNFLRHPDKRHAGRRPLQSRLHRPFSGHFSPVFLLFLGIYLAFICHFPAIFFLFFRHFSWRFSPRPNFPLYGRADGTEEGF
ncbi:MAG: hypothetical protein KGI29_01415 [Pseudomonadota bacterium]|nr:hypothetical protein [Pseudomonadota bacterium]MDE3037253.1 hypothetical protein [Pseudomonadota bacterium]